MNSIKQGEILFQKDKLSSKLVLITIMESDLPEKKLLLMFTSRQENKIITITVNYLRANIFSKSETKATFVISDLCATNLSYQFLRNNLWI